MTARSNRAITSGDGTTSSRSSKPPGCAEPKSCTSADSPCQPCSGACAAAESGADQSCSASASSTISSGSGSGAAATAASGGGAGSGSCISAATGSGSNSDSAGAGSASSGSGAAGLSGSASVRLGTCSDCSAAAQSIPVATTLTRITPSIEVSRVEPTMMLASASTSSRIRLAASSTSNSVRSWLPVMLMSTPRAPLRLISSRSGLAIAFSAALTARSSPLSSPVPIIALPISSMTARTSAKSRLMRPGRTIRSVTPLTPWCSTSSAIEKASAKVVFSLASRKRFWFGMMISVSTTFCSSSTPDSAWRMRLAPSNWNGLVTTPTVRIPSSRADCAMIGAAPVPVPPPMPAAMKHMCDPAR